MNASVAIQVLPSVTSEDEIIRIVDEVIDYIKTNCLKDEPEGGYEHRYRDDAPQSDGSGEEF